MTGYQLTRRHPGVMRDVVEDEWLMVRTVATKKDEDKTGKYGRYLVEIFKDGRSVNDDAVAAGHAEYSAQYAVP